MGTFQGINITPFTDVLLVLLIIFLIAGSSLAPTGVDLKGLSPVVAAQGSETPHEALVWVSKEGERTIQWRGATVTLEQLKARESKPEIIIAAHPECKTGQVVGAYDDFLKAGFSRVKFGSPLEFEE